MDSYTIMTKTASTETISNNLPQSFELFHLYLIFLIGLVPAFSSSSGGFFSFAYETDAWKVKKLDSEDNAYSLCTHKSIDSSSRQFAFLLILMSLDTDLQCDFNNPFWEEVECAWSFKPSEGLVTSPLRRMEWVKNKDFKSSNYWLDKYSREFCSWCQNLISLARA